MSHHKEESLISHLQELRSRLIKILVVLLALFLIAALFSRELFELFARPIILSLTDSNSLTIRKPLDSFLIPLKLSLFTAFILTLPWTLYQVWAFVAPGLYKTERKLVYPLVISSTALFYLGMLFAYFIVLPLAFKFLSGFTPTGANYTPDIAYYFSFVFTVFFAFGIAFEIPIATILVVALGITDIDTIKSKRRHIIVAAFIFGMLLTPPDIISQTLLALPVLLLFEIGLLFAKRFENRSPASDSVSDSVSDSASDSVSNPSNDRPSDRPNNRPSDTPAE